MNVCVFASPPYTHIPHHFGAVLFWRTFPTRPSSICWEGLLVNPSGFWPLQSSYSLRNTGPKLGKGRSLPGGKFCLTQGSKDDLFLRVACQPGAASNQLLPCGESTPGNEEAQRKAKAGNEEHKIVAPGPSHTTVKCSVKRVDPVRKPTELTQKISIKREKE